MDGDWAFGFDDDIFTKSKVNQRPQLVSYNAKFCSKQWFQTVEDTDSSDWLNVCKYKAEYAYREKNYTEALQHYQAYLGTRKEVLPASSLALWRDAQEGCVRCYLALQQSQEALQAALKLEENAMNIEHKTSSLQALSQVYRQLRQLHDWLKTAQSLVTLHPLNSDFWLQLAEVYRQRMSSAGHTEMYTQCTDTEQAGKDTDSAHGILEHASHIGEQAENASDTVQNEIGEESCSKPPVSISEQLNELSLRQNLCPDSTNDKTGHITPVLNDRISGHITKSTSSEQTEHCVKQTTENKKCTTGLDLKLALLTCLIRARLLLQSVQGTVQSFAKSRNATLQEQVNKEIKQLHVTEDVSMKCIQFLYKDQDLYKAGSTCSSSTSEANEAKSTEVADTETNDEASNQNSDVADTDSVQEFERRWFSWMT